AASPSPRPPPSQTADSWARDFPWPDRTNRLESGPLFFGGFDPPGHRIRKHLLVQIASLLDDGRLAGVQDGAIRCGQGQSLEFLVIGEQTSNHSLARGRNLDHGGRVHKQTSVFKGGESLFTQISP